MSNMRFDNPEVSSKPLKVNLATGFSSRTILEIESRTANDLSTDDDGTEINDYVRGSITAAEGIEISITRDSDQATHLGVKYQFYGEHSDKSNKGNFSQAITLGYEQNSSTDSYASLNSVAPTECTELICTFSREEANTYWEHDANIYDIAWVLGYKLSEKSIIYGGPFYQWGNINGYKGINTQYITQEYPNSEAGEFTTQESSYSKDIQLKLDSSGYMLGANLAVEHRFSFGLGFAAEVVVSKMSWDKYSISDTGINLKMDYQF